jgi:hypothetical protein
MSDIMSDMRMNNEEGVYTVRDLNRRTAEVLAEAAKLGSVTIRSRSGERFVLKPEPRPSGGRERLLARLPGQRARLRTLGHQDPTEAAWKRLDELVAGEE